MCLASGWCHDGRAQPLIPESGNYLPPGRIQNTCEAQHYVLAGIRGRLWLPGGTVRVSRPWLPSTDLSRALAGVFATAAFGIVSTDIWPSVYERRGDMDEHEQRGVEAGEQGEPGSEVGQAWRDHRIIGPGVLSTGAKWARIEALLPGRTLKGVGWWRDPAGRSG
ncbi:hypothetical protein [Streptomyces sp. NPDC057696]|uniref:hypothetical protein n=1 Tax=Streptomyces sp. NPDC057696 TaxID=3346218 RepID=UPI00367D20BD